MKNAGDLDWMLGRIVDDQIITHRPEFYRLIRQISPGMSNTRLLGQKPHCRAKPLLVALGR